MKNQNQNQKIKRTFEKVTEKRETYLKSDEIKKGFVIEGEVVEVRTREAHGNFKEQKQIIIKKEDEQLVILPSHYTINSSLINPQNENDLIGEYIRLTYEGQAKPKGNRKGLQMWDIEKAV